MPSSIQNPPSSARVRSHSDTRTRSGSATGTAHDAASASSKRVLSDGAGRACSIVATNAQLRATAWASVGLRRLDADHAPTGDDVDRLVLAIGAGDPEEEREPAPEPELPFAGELTAEHERPADLVEVHAGVLRHAVD